MKPEPPTTIEQVPELIDDTDAAANRRRYSCACDAHLRKRPEAEYQARIKNDVEAVREPE